MRISLSVITLVVLFLCLASPVATYAQSNSATIRGTVLDPSGAAISGSTVEIENPVSHYNRSAQTDSQGHFEFDNVPFNNYHTTAAAQGFQTGTEDVDCAIHRAYRSQLQSEDRRRDNQCDRGGCGGSAPDRFHHAHRRGSRAVR